MKRIALLLALLIMLQISAPYVGASDDKNLALGCSYTVEGGTNDKYSYARYSESDEKTYNKGSTALTDGATSPASMSANGYYKAFRGVSRLVCFDFGSEKAITAYGGSFLQGLLGVTAPTYIKLWLSNDGSNYVLVSTKDNTPVYSENAKKLVCKSDLGKAYKARYAKVEFDVGVFVYCDEIYVYGNDGISSAEALPNYTPAADKGYFPRYTEKSNGSGCIIKIYDGFFAPNQALADNTVEKLLPYVAYTSKNGDILDTFFDSVAFVPCHGDYPSGGRLVQTSDKPGGIMSDWEEYFYHTFGKNKNVEALDRAVEKRNNALNINEKVNVYLTIPYPKNQSNAFGDVDSDGKAEFTDTLEGRTKVIRWYVEKVVDMFKKGNYSHLSLAGFYWYREEIGYADSDHDDKLISEVKAITSEFLPSSKLLFDPFYLSVGFDRWESYGFDMAVMQPNLVFRDYFKTQMLDEFAAQIKKYGLGVEIETAEPGNFVDKESNEKYGKLYENYLYYGVKTGYMSALCTFYQGAGPGAIYKFCKSDDEYLNYLYKKTYDYVKQTADFSEADVSLSDITLPMNSSREKINLNLSSELYKPHITVEADAVFGVVMPLSKEAITYSPKKGFQGKDTLTVIITDGLGRKTKKSATVTIGNGDISSSIGYCAVRSAKNSVK